MRSHTYARGLVVSGLFAVILGLILVVGMTQSFASGNTETGVILLVLLGVNVLANVIYQAFTSNRSEQRPASKATAVIRKPAPSNATPLDVADNEEITELMDANSNAPGERNKPASSEKDQPQAEPLSLNQLNAALFIFMIGWQENQDELVNRIRVDDQLDPEMMSLPLVSFRAFAVELGVAGEMGETPERDKLLDKLYETLRSLYVDSSEDLAQELYGHVLGGIKALHEAYNEALKTSAAPNPYWYVGKAFSHLCGVEKDYVMQTTLMTSLFMDYLVYVSALVKSTNLPS